MYKPVNIVEVFIWGDRVGVVALDQLNGYYAFEYDKAWLKKDIDLFKTSLTSKNQSQNTPLVFTDLPEKTFYRLPAFLADALPDNFGNALIDAALSGEGVSKEMITPLDRLAYM
jgi:serine/threonine-protein kinase HipA